MLVLITYDVNTEDASGQCRSLQAKLCEIMDKEKDSLRFYYLGDRYEKKVEHFGCKQSYRPEEPLIL